MIRPFALTFISLPLLAIPAIASAQDAATLPGVDVADAVFPTMGPDGSSTQLGAQVMFMMPDGGDEALKRLDLQGQFVSPSGIGGYATLGASQVEDEFSLGAIEGGALYRSRSGNIDFVARAGIILPTAENDGEFPLHLISTAFSRPSDYLTGAPETTSLRIAISPSTRSGNFVARADVGLDMAVAGELADELDGAFLHADFGAGFHNGKAGALLELGTMAYLEETDSLLHIIAVTAEMSSGRVTPFLSISKPFQSGEGSDDIDLINIALGMRGQL